MYNCRILPATYFGMVFFYSHIPCNSHSILWTPKSTRLLLIITDVEYLSNIYRKFYSNVKGTKSGVSHLLANKLIKVYEKEDISTSPEKPNCCHWFNNTEKQRGYQFPYHSILVKQPRQFARTFCTHTPAHSHAHHTCAQAHIHTHIDIEQNWSARSLPGLNITTHHSIPCHKISSTRALPEHIQLQ
jgi:hypothetical protein